MAMTLPTSCLRGKSQLLNRTWTSSPSCFHYQAYTPRNRIKYTLNTYQVSHTSPRMATPQRRNFHSSRPLRQQTKSAIPHIGLHIAAASSGKGRKYEAEKSTLDFVPGTKALGLQGDGSVYQRRRNRPDSGEDAYFVTNVGQDETTVALGVCDGVGGWSDQGVNPADFSHGMCGYMSDHASNFEPQAGKEETLHPMKLMHLAYDDTLQDKQIRAGGATACVAVADANGRMRIANLGDSGFIQLRLGSVHQAFKPQTHAFNTPYQLSKTPHEIMTQAAIFGGLPLNDSPDRADVSDNQLQHGDVVIFATDGVWDNLSQQDILTIASKLMRERGAWDRTDDKGTLVSNNISTLVRPNTNDKQQQQSWSLQSTIAAHIVGEAKVASMDRKRDGPFAKAVQREYPMDRWHGGKIDDITVLVLIAIENKDTSQEQIKAKL